MAGGASTWASRRSGQKQEPADDAEGASSASSVSSASEEPFWEQHEGKYFLPPDHRPLMLLPGWDQPPAPPPEPDTGSESGSESGSDSGDSESGSESEGSESPGGDEAPEQPPAQIVPSGFSCATCRYFKAQGNGMFGCENTNYQRYAGTDKLVESKSGRPVQNPMMVCSDWYEPATGPTAKPVPTRFNKQ